jgi:hypothetical protein
MHYENHRSHRMQKQKFGITCPSAHFMETRSGPPEHEKECDHISCPGRTRMHYVTHRSHRMQKHMFSVTCPCALYMETTPDPHEHEK